MNLPRWPAFCVAFLWGVMMSGCVGHASAYDGGGASREGLRAAYPVRLGEATGLAPASGAPISGTASWYRASGLIAAAGPALRHGDWRGSTVIVTANGRSVQVTLSDWCACPRRLIDLSDDAFRQLAPLSRGLVRVVVTTGNASATIPPTDTAPSVLPPPYPVVYTRHMGSRPS